MRAPVLLLAPVLALAFTGCTTKIDDKKGEKAIQKSAEDLGIAVKSVDCPSGKTAKKGDTFNCTVTAKDGSSGTAVVTEKDDKGNVEYNAPFVKPSTLNDGVAATLSKQVGVNDVKVDCPDIVELKKGGQTECAATGGGEKVTVVVKFTDDQGNYTIHVKGQ